MFYDKSVMNSDILGSVWKLANNMSSENVEDCSLPTICNELDTLVNSDADEPRRRLSLRASSNLIGGAARLYKSGVNKLFEDINQLDESIWRRKRTYSNTNLETSSSESVTSPEEMRRQASITVGSDTSLPSTKRSRFEQSALQITSRLTMSRSSTSSLISGRVGLSGGSHGQCSKSNSDISPTNIDKFTASNSSTSFHPENLLVSEENAGNLRIDKEVQTSPILSIRRPSSIGEIDKAFDTKLPFGYILIHDDYRTRIPSKIIFTSINSDIMYI